MNAPVFFSNAGDERGTPDDLFDRLNAEFHFDLDAAANQYNHKCEMYFGPGGIAENALTEDWGGLTVWLNPPFSMADDFVAKAREEADKGATVVLLLPVRSDTKYWHKYIWDVSATPDGNWRPGVRCRMLPGRVTFTLHVPDDLRAWIKSEWKAASADIDQDVSRAKVWGAWIPGIVEITGLPKMAVSRILQDYPNDDLLEGAPFPSCVVIFTKSH